jgi:hypothetical protein
MTKLKVLVIVLAVIIIVLFGILFFYQPAHSPTIQPLPPVAGPTVFSPRADDLVASPLTIAGQVIGGGWFFEASFPVQVVDGDGTVIGGGQAKAQTDWMTTSSVPFVAVASFTAPRYATGTVVLWKDNPSGLPTNNASFTVPVRFK